MQMKITHRSVVGGAMVSTTVCTSPWRLWSGEQLLFDIDAPLPQVVVQERQSNKAHRSAAKVSGLRKWPK